MLYGFLRAFSFLLLVCIPPGLCRFDVAALPLLGAASQQKSPAPHHRGPSTPGSRARSGYATRRRPGRRSCDHRGSRARCGRCAIGYGRACRRLLAQPLVEVVRTIGANVMDNRHHAALTVANGLQHVKRGPRRCPSRPGGCAVLLLHGRSG